MCPFRLRCRCHECSRHFLCDCVTCIHCPYRGAFTPLLWPCRIFSLPWGRHCDGTTTMNTTHLHTLHMVLHSGRLYGESSRMHDGHYCSGVADYQRGEASSITIDLNHSDPHNCFHFHHDGGPCLPIESLVHQQMEEVERYIFLSTHFGL